jgi:hypothetical protein
MSLRQGIIVDILPIGDGASVGLLMLAFKRKPQVPYGAVSC